MKLFLTIGWLCLLFTTLPVLSKPTFPKLTGRVVDSANILDARAEAQLSAGLQAHERATGNQVVIATLKSLQGYDIRDYGYQLGRHWKLGQKGKDNAVILLVAPFDRKVAIEVGYGLEGILTDAISHNIIQTQLLPAFRNKQFSQGVAKATTAIIDALGGQYKMVAQTRAVERKKNSWVSLLVFGFFALQFLGGLGGRRRRYGRRGFFYGGGIPARSSGFSGGSFTGGGGSFGGGGASGGW